MDSSSGTLKPDSASIKLEAFAIAHVVNHTGRRQEISRMT